MILLPPITREEDLIPAIDLLDRGEAIVVAASFRRPESLPADVIWHAEASEKQLRCVRRKSNAEIERESFGSRLSSMFGLSKSELREGVQNASPCSCS